MPTTRPTMLAALGLSVVLLAGCAPTEPPTPDPSPSVTTPFPSPSATPTATPDTVGPPSTADDAIAQAVDTIGRYMQLRSAVYADPSGQQDLTALVGGAAESRLRDEASQLAAQGIHAEGQFRFETSSGQASEAIVDGTATPFGTVTLDGCYDSTQVELLYADGRPIPVADVRRVRFQPVLVYRPATQSWIVFDTPSPAEPEPC